MLQGTCQEKKNLATKIPQDFHVNISHLTTCGDHHRELLSFETQQCLTEELATLEADKLLENNGDEMCN